MRRGEKESNPTTVGCGLTRPLMCRNRTPSFFGEAEKRMVVTVLNALGVVQGPTGVLDTILGGHRLSTGMFQALGRLSYPIPAKDCSVRSRKW